VVLIARKINGFRRRYIDDILWYPFSISYALAAYVLGNWGPSQLVWVPLLVVIGFLGLAVITFGTSRRRHGKGRGEPN
jgi:hypothetical protein